MKILVTGASGLLGSELMKAIPARPHTAAALDRCTFIAASPLERLSLLEGFDTIIHAAANTNVEQCEIDPEACFRDNCFLTEELFRLSRRLNVKFVFISSTGVYGRGKATPYHEYDPVAPTTVHHQSKYMAERTVVTDQKSLIVRTGWLFGGNLSNPKNFVANRIHEARMTRETLFANDRQTGSPTYVVDCARRLLDLLDDDCTGVYNVVNNQTATRLDYVREIVQLAASPLNVMPFEALGLKRHADVSENESAVSFKMRYEARAEIRPWKDALAEYMRDFGLLGCLAEKLH